jgi:hypothetical protein
MSSVKEWFPFVHIPFKAGFTILTFMIVLFKVIRISIQKLKHQELKMEVL